MIVVDASVLANALADDSDAGDATRARLAAGSDLHAPHIVDLEVLSVLRKALSARMLDERRAGLALNDLRDLRLTRYPHAPFATRIWELRENLTHYDAAYVALAEELGCPFVTADRRLGRSPLITCQVEVLPW